MHALARPVLALLAALAALSPARAQLSINGTTRGVFVDAALPYTSVINGPVVSLFSSGVPYRPAAPHFDTQTSIAFTGQTFSDLAPGDTALIGSLKLTNGVTLLGTTASWAAMDLFVTVPGHGISDLKLTTLLFAIDNTSNDGAKNIPDLFLIGYTAPQPFYVEDNRVSIGLSFSQPAFTFAPGAPIGEGRWTTENIYGRYELTPVPEASTFAFGGAALLLGAIAIRRRRHRQRQRPLAA